MSSATTTDKLQLSNMINITGKTEAELKCNGNHDFNESVSPVSASWDDIKKTVIMKVRLTNGNEVCLNIEEVMNNLHLVKSRTSVNTTSRKAANRLTKLIETYDGNNNHIKQSILNLIDSCIKLHQAVIDKCKKKKAPAPATATATAPAPVCTNTETKETAAINKYTELRALIETTYYNADKTKQFADDLFKHMDDKETERLLSLVNSEKTTNKQKAAAASKLQAKANASSAKAIKEPSNKGKLAIAKMTLAITSIAKTLKELRFKPLTDENIKKAKININEAVTAVTEANNAATEANNAVTTAGSSAGSTVVNAKTAVDSVTTSTTTNDINDAINAVDTASKKIHAALTELNKLYDKKAGAQQKYLKYKQKYLQLKAQYGL